MENNFFYLPKKYRWIYFISISMIVFACAYFMFPWMILNYYHRNLPDYVMYDMINESLHIFWFFETLVFGLNCWILSWSKIPHLKYYLAGFIFIIGWLGTITDFRYPSLEIVGGTGFLCALYYLLVLVVQQIDRRFNI